MKAPPPRPAPRKSAVPANPAQRARLNAALQPLRAQFLAATARGEHARALQLASQAWQRARLPQALADIAMCQLRLGQHTQAYDTYRRAIRLLPAANTCDGLAEAAGWLGHAADVRTYGSMALRLKDEEALRENAARPLPGAPPPFDARDPQRNLIAFSLYGADPRYCETAVLNVRAARTLHPAWTCRFYVDDSVPAALWQRLVAEGAQVVHAAAVGGAGLPGTMWRFLALDDPAALRVQVRDVDSLLSTRDQAATQAWCDSQRWFHVMRDWHSHTELMLAGMWSACTGAVTGVAELARQYLGSRPASATHADQHFLRHCLWPTVRQSVLSHDEHFDFPGNMPFPSHAPVAVAERYSHVGCNIGAPTMAVRHAAPDGTAVTWTLYDAAGIEVCTYPATVVQGRFSAHLPEPYAAELGAGRWKVVTRTAALRPSPRTVPAA